MATDSFTTRNGEIATSEGAPTELNSRHVSIDIISTLPLVYMEKRGLTQDIADADSTLETITPILPADVKNFLVDADNPDRFVYLGNAVSIITNMKVQFYYDLTYQDIIVIPDLETLGTGVMSAARETATVKLTGYRISSGKASSVMIQELKIGVNSIDKKNLPLARRLPSTTTLLYTLPGLNSHSTYESVDSPILNGKVIRNGAVPTQFISLGSNTVVFGSPQKIPTYNLLQQTPEKSVLEYMGMLEAPEVLIPLIF